MPNRAAEPAGPHPPAAEPIAVVGVGCRFPGGVRDLDSFGDVLTSGGDVLREVPPDRWGPEYRAAEPGGTGTANHVGGFLDDIDRFDAGYFGISPKEACHLDPQQRILLEVAWEAMSDSGRPRDAWRGSRTAVFMGMLAGDYNLLHVKTLGTAGVGPHYAAGTEFSFAAGRLAYAFDMHGPVATLNSACSSSLLAVHQACQYLRNGECDTAVAGGVGLLICPELSIFLSSVGAMSPTGRCRPFDAAADGLIRGEGAGAVVLKRLSAAQADGDRIHAVIRGSAVTHDGASLGLTAPNAAAQAAMLHGAIEAAGVDPRDVDYVEAHGTGTQLGDQIELAMIADAYGAGRPADRPVFVGSLKAVFGHLDAAAGVAGLLKAIWVAANGRVPAQPHFSTPNPAVDWANGGIAVSCETTPLEVAGRPARAAVSAIGLSGTNVHMIVEAAGEDAPPADVNAGPYVLLASAAHRDRLAEQVTRLFDRVSAAGDRLGDLVASTTTRSTFEAYRYAAVGADRDALLAALGDPDEPPEGAYTGYVPDPEDAPRPVFVYSGQGGQWAGMAADLYDTDPTVRSALDECDALIRAEASWSLLEELHRAREEELDRTDLAQPSIFAVQVAVTRWLIERGVVPAAVIGHSLGEVAAAHVAGALSLPDAVRVIVRRAELLHGTAGTGLMYAVRADPETVAALLAETGLPVTVAAVNGPSSVVIAGPAEEVTRAAAVVEERGLRCRRLLVDAASHSRVVAHCGPLLGAATAGIVPVAPSIRLLSSVDPGADSVRPDSAYWARNLTEPVRLWPAVDRLLSGADHLLVEIGPHPVLVPALTDALEHRGRPHSAIGTLRRDEPGALALCRALARLHAAGAAVDWEKVTGRPRRYEPLPLPSWGGDRYWLPGVERGTQTRAAAPARIRLSLLDADGRVTGELLAHPTGPSAPPAAELALSRDDRPARDGATGRSPVALPLDGPSAVHSQPPENRSPVAPAAGAVRSSLDRTPPADAAAPGDLADRVEAVVREVLGLSAGRALVRRRGLFEQGLDSLTAAELRRRLDAAFGVRLPAPIVFERPTIAALAAHLSDIAPVPAAEPVTAAAPSGGDAVAVIGIACRLPGAGSPGELWTLLTEGRSSVSEPPPGRRDDPIWAEADGIPTRSCYLDDVAGFDAPFFRVSPREAKSLDPQQRLFLEVAWEALEDAGRPARTLAGRPVGVYVGLEAADYQQLLTRHMDNVNLYYGTGASFAAVSGRLSYFLGLSGPSLVVDTACSGSLTAVHLACQGLRNGDCEIAVVGGAHVMIAPTMMVAMTESKALAGDGRCKTFDDDADGYGCGEGAAVLVLKPLAAAQRDGDRVYSVIRGTAVNQDGASGGFTVPNAAAQAALIRQALDRAGWAPDEVDYVEAHGTGTPLGDPIEVNALAEAYGAGRDGDRAPLLIGSAKPNVGHLAAAAGAVGLVKVALALREGRIPPHLLNRPSTRIDWDRLPVRIPVEGCEWPDRGRPARAGISSFGLTGTNAHVLLEAAPAVREADEPAGLEPPYVLPLSAASGAALRAVAARMAGRLRAAPDELPGILFTATYRRSWLGHRLAVVADDAAGLAAALDEVAAGGTPRAARFGEAVVEEARAVAFRYTASAPPRDRFTAVPVYERALAACADELATATGRRCDLRAEPPEELRAAYAFCHRVATTELWAAYGVRPARAYGEGDGEVAALWAVGRLPLARSLRILLGEEDRPAAAAKTGTYPLVVTPLDLGEDPLGVIAAETARVFAAGYEPPAEVPPRPPVSLPGYPWEHRAYWYRDLPVPAAVPWVLSGRDAGGLRDAAGRVLAFAAGHPEAEPAAIGAALAARPAGHERAVVVGRDRTDLLDGLRALAEGRDDPGLITGTGTGTGGVVLVFPGQGGQWAGMGLDLLAVSPVFAEHLHACDEALRPHTGWSLLDVLRSEGPGLDRVDVVQPALFGVMVSLARLWQSLGVRPSAVVGHSQGEIAAAHVAGALSLEDAARVSALRGRALTRLSGRGGMASLALSRADALGLLATWGDRLCLASDNGPRSVVVAGDAIGELLAHCERHDVRARRVPVDYASHSPHVEAIRAELLEALADLTPRAAEIPMCSTLTGEPIDTTTLDAAYWYRNLREPVEFQRAVRTLVSRGDTTFIEVGPHPVLGFALEETVPDGVVVPTLRRDDGGHERFYTSLAQAHVHAALDWRPLFRGVEPARLTPEAADVHGEAEFWAAVEREDAGELAATVGLADGSLDALVPLLAAWRRRRRARSAADGWRYRIAWTPVDDGEPAALYGTWLVVVPEDAGDPWIDGCVRALADHGADVRRLQVAADTGRTGLAALLREAAGEDRAPAGVVSLLAFAPDRDAAEPVVPAGLAATTALVQALGDACPEAPLWVLTRGAVSTGAGDRVRDPVQAHVLGLSRVLALDEPGRWGGQVDLPETADENARARLARALAGIGEEDQLAVRGPGIAARRLVPAPPPDGGSRTWRPHGTVLVTGGTGALGGHVARRLAREGADHLLLLSRRGTYAPGAEALARDLAALGAEVTIAACDITDAGALAEVLAGVPAEHPLTAVVHTAAVVGRRVPVDGIEAADLAETCAAKAAGARNLDRLLSDTPLERFVLFSSNAGVWGSGGQGPYAAANAYLDALAEDRRGRGLPATSVAWGAWAGEGGSAGAAEAAFLARRGVRAMPPEQAVEALWRALEDDETFVAVADVDWAVFADGFTAARARPLIHDLPGVRREAAPPDRRTDGAALTARLLPLPADARERLLLDVVRAEVARVLQHDEPGTIERDRAFKELGFDSVTGVELRNRLGAVTGLRLAAAIVFDHPTPTELARHLLAELFPGEERAGSIDSMDVADLVQLAHRDGS